MATTLNYCSTIAIIVTTVNSSHTIVDTILGSTFWATFITLGRFGLFQRLPSPYGLYDLHDDTVKYQLKFRCSVDNYYTLAFSVALRSRENPAGRRAAAAADRGRALPLAGGAPPPRRCSCTTRLPWGKRQPPSTLPTHVSYSPWPWCT